MMPQRRAQLLPPAGRPDSLLGALGLVLLLSVGATSCSVTPTSPTVAEDPCLSALGQSSAACADPQRAGPLQIRDLPIDDSTLYSRLAEIKLWLAAEKARLRGEPVPEAANAELIPAAPEPLTRLSSPEETLAAAISLADRGQNNEALGLIQAYRGLNPGDLSAALVESRILFQQGQPRQAETLLRQLLLEYPHTAELYNNLAVIQAAQGNLGGAIQTLQQAFATDPSFARIQQNLKALYSASASQALLQERQPARPQLDMIDLIPQR